MWSSPSRYNAAPNAGSNVPLSGKITSLSSRDKYSIKAFRKAGINVNGPPQNNTGVSISYPWANVITVCTATAWKIEAAISSRLTFRATKFWISVLQNTPQREAIGYTRVAFRASRFNSSTFTPRITAIWSMNAPVPPAQLPFIRKSIASASLKKTTFASSPPISIMDPTCGYPCCMAFVAATTSCTKGKEHFSEIPIPIEPVIFTEISASPSKENNSLKKWIIVSFALAWCRSYFENKILSYSSTATNLAVVEPISIPILIIAYTFYIYVLHYCQTQI